MGCTIGVLELTKIEVDEGSGGFVTTDPCCKGFHRHGEEPASRSLA